MYRWYGIDIGSTFIDIFERNSSKLIKRERHNGKIIEMLKTFVDSVDYNARITVTGKSAKDYFSRTADVYAEESEAVAHAVRKSKVLPGGYGKIVDIGASSLTLYTVKNGRISDIQQNSLCAAGTGLFLEEQAERLEINLTETGEFEIDDPPLVASRCTVFAKSDLIHHQQEGRTKNEMWSGLCRSLACSAMNTLFRSEEVYGKIVLIGGVSLNREVVKWLKKNYMDAEWIIPEKSASFIAFGASCMNGIKKEYFSMPEGRIIGEKEKMPLLTLNKSRYPHFTFPAFDEMGNEIRIHRDIENPLNVAVGMDIGSTSTKLIAIEEKTKEPVLDIYRKTHGDPFSAAKKLFSAFYKIADKKKMEITAFGTTGSGRRLIGEIFNADKIVNEITAHGKGTGTFFPDVETIFEIGGQDAKYIRLKNGNVSDVNMNYVCAAGTGSFIEEQVRKLGFSLFDAGKIVQDITPPVTSDRCTVFMEQDMRKLLESGYSKEEVLASVHYSIIKNYLTRVVGNRYVSKSKIFFQGATARNKGLVAAFENLTGVEVVVSPFCHVMGSLGAAINAVETVEKENRKTSFIGKMSVNLEVESRKDVCKLCNNYCRINHISTGDGRETSWGYQCGRDPSVEGRKKLKGYSLFEKRRKIIFNESKFSSSEKRAIVGIPASLANYSFYPLWAAFFASLGFETKPSSFSTTRKVKNHASKISSGDFCFPVKASMGHVISLLEKNLPIFQPSYIAEEPELDLAINYFCPYVESNPGVIRSAVQKSRFKLKNFMSPVIDLRQKEKEIVKELYNSIKDILNVKRKEVKKAWCFAIEQHRKIERQLKEEGEKHIEKLAAGKKPFFIMMGRPYNIHDRGINLGIPETIASMGYDIVPIDMLDLNIASLSKSNYYNLFWHYGQKIVAASRHIRDIKNAYPIYLTNFNCGPDSFILSYAEEELKSKPMLILELDEHDSDGGYKTRIEAFVDVVENLSSKEEESENILKDRFGSEYNPDLRGTIWIPPMHETGTPLLSSAFRGFGYDSRPIEMENENVFQQGKKHLRGGECLPMTLTLGAVLEKVKENNENYNILFMPTAEGPCRFGQYNMLERIVFHNEKINNVDILSPSSLNSYQGIDEKLRKYLMHAMMSADILMKLRTKVKPYEKRDGDTLSLYRKSIKKLEKVFEKKGNARKALEKIAKDFAAIPQHNNRKPLVGIVGEIYVRCNPFANQNLIDVIEESGGEAWLSPMHEWILYTAKMQNHLDKKHGATILKRSESVVKNMYLFKTEKAYYSSVKNLLHNREEPNINKVLAEGEKYLPLDFTGEAILTVGRTVLFAEQGAAMVVNASPFSCMPGTITSSIFHEVKDRYNMPIVSQFYDGEIKINDKVASLLKTINFT